jgi:hypothetical protein
MRYLYVMDHEPEPVLSEAEEDLLIYTGEPQGTGDATTSRTPKITAEPA